jgi:hypothetical protein
MEYTQEPIGSFNDLKTSAGAAPPGVSAIPGIVPTRFLLFQAASQPK